MLKLRYVMSGFLSCVLASAAQAQMRPVAEFLQASYGLEYRVDAAVAERWMCPADSQDKPSEKISRARVCKLGNPRLQREILWSKDDKELGAVEYMVIATGMSGGPQAPFGLPDCRQESFTLKGAKAPGILRDCRIPLRNGDFYVSFAHLAQHGVQLTLLVRNADRNGSTPDVVKELRSWLGELSSVD